MRFFLILSAAACVCAHAADTADDSLVRWKPYGLASLELGQVYKGKQMVRDIEHRWMQYATIGIGVQAALNSNVNIRAGIEGRTWTTFQSLETYDPNEMEEFLHLYIDEAEGTYTVASNENFRADLGIGIFRYKYNPQARNLGEYLFRSGVYPGYLVTNFDSPFARLAGLRISGSLIDKMNLSFILSSERMFPFNDISLSVLGDCGSFYGLDFGAGINFHRLLPVDPKRTTPPLDPLSGDSVEYSFAGTKLMARFSFDPKALWTTGIDEGIWGTEDLKIYGEAAILGLKDYPIYYEKIEERIPVMLGMCIPTTRWGLDVLAFEMEWYGTRNADSYESIIKNQSPEPVNVSERTDVETLADNVKWSLYCSRTVSRGFSVCAHAARDHSRSDEYTYSIHQKDYKPITRSQLHWYYMVKARYDF
jgi:hypothetical protein